MIRRLNKLAAAAAANAQPGWLSDGGGLFLRADDEGRKRWIFRYTFGGKKKEMGLGSADAVTLANARAEARRLREAVAQGRDPLSERRHAVAVAATVKMFAEVARIVIERDKVGWGQARAKPASGRCSITPSAWGQWKSTQSTSSMSSRFCNRCGTVTSMRAPARP